MLNLFDRLFQEYTVNCYQGFLKVYYSSRLFSAHNFPASPFNKIEKLLIER